MGYQPDPHYLLSLDDALKHSKLSRVKLTMAVGTGQVRCGVMARDWEGVALPNLHPNRFDWVCNGRCESKEGTEDYLYTERNSEITRTVRKFSLTLFWYLSHYEAYNVLVKEPAPIGWLYPFEGSAFHEADPEGFPDPSFIVVLMKPPIIVATDLVFVTTDLDNWQPPIGPLPETIPSRTKGSLYELISAMCVSFYGSIPSVDELQDEIQVKFSKEFDRDFLKKTLEKATEKLPKVR